MTYATKFVKSGFLKGDWHRKQGGHLHRHAHPMHEPWLDPDCEPTTNRIVDLISGHMSPQYPASSYAVVTDQVLLIDQALARTHQLEKELFEAKVQHARDVQALSTRLEQLISKLHMPWGAPPVLSPPNADALESQILGPLDDELRHSFGDEYRGITCRRVIDHDLGDILEIRVSLSISRNRSRSARTLVFETFDRLTKELDTSSIVLLIEASAS